MAYCVDDTGFTRSARPTALLRTNIGAVLRKWLTRRQAFNDLKLLTPRHLQDIGVDRHDIAATIDRELSRLPRDEFRSRGW
ncbi:MULTISPECIES: DUF1127 domain-containing protein [unclassified Mesorhizobium]|uniref:DUF1127 domain-containing protein n=1 Tax=unclassified Mesorhizobium TaxID=325217 RepID=UPI003014CD92